MATYSKYPKTILGPYYHIFSTDYIILNNYKLFGLKKNLKIFEKIMNDPKIFLEVYYEESVCDVCILNIFSLFNSF